MSSASPGRGMFPTIPPSRVHLVTIDQSHDTDVIVGQTLLGNRNCTEASFIISRPVNTPLIPPKQSSELGMEAGSPLRTKVRRVHATRNDGFFWPASLEGQSSSADMYAVTFDDGHKAELPRECIVGTGFQSISDVHLKHGQRVLYCVGGREFEADVLEYSLAQRHALVSLNDGTEVVVQPSDLHLPEHHRCSSLDDGYASASPDTLSLSSLSPK